jgi:hypothetical protein
MISMIMRLDVQNNESRGVRLFFPVIIVWIIALALLLVALPFVLIAALVTVGRGPGIRLLGFYPVFFQMLFASSGLRIDVAGRGNGKVFIAFN